METDQDRVVASARAVLPAAGRRHTDLTTRGFTFTALLIQFAWSVRTEFVGPH
jgi:hypothetical protein